MARILVCLNTLLDLVLQPGWDNDYEEFEQRREGCERLLALIESDQVNLYILESMIDLAHIAVRARFGTQQAHQAVIKILQLGSSYPKVDHEWLIDHINQIEALSDEAELYDVKCLVYAHTAAIDAIVVRHPTLFYQLIEQNSQIFQNFRISICNLATFIPIFETTRTSLGKMKQVIYPFTPQQMIVKLPWGSTPIDFAYKIHTKVGDRCIGAFVNQQEVPLNYQLRTGDVVEILKGDAVNPDPNWLDFVVTRTAKKGIYRGLRYNQAQQGWQIIKQHLGSNVPAYRRQLEHIASISNFSSVDELARGIGAEEVPLLQFNTLIKMVQEEWVKPPFDIAAKNGQHWRIASCCIPLPGDEICGVVRSPKQPIKVHAKDCQTLSTFDSYRLQELYWNCDCSRVHLQLTLSDEPDTFRPILNKLVENDLTPDLRNLTIANGAAKATIGIDVSSRGHLEEIQKKIVDVPNVLGVRLAKPILMTSNAIALAN